MNIIFPYDTTEIGGSYTSIAIFASELIKDKNYNITFYLPRKGLNTQLFLDTGANIKFYNLYKLIENPNLRTLFGNESRMIYEKNFSLEKGIKKLKSYYLTVYQSDK